MKVEGIYVYLYMIIHIHIIFFCFLCLQKVRLLVRIEDDVPTLRAKMQAAAQGGAWVVLNDKLINNRTDYFILHFKKTQPDPVRFVIKYIDVLNVIKMCLGCMWNKSAVSYCLSFFCKTKDSTQTHTHTDTHTRTHTITHLTYNYYIDI